MDREKQIEEIAREMCHLSAECKTCQICNERYHGGDDLCYFQCVAKEIINHGYRKQSEVDWHREAELNAQRIIELEAELVKAKQEVAREIFEMIITTIFSKMPSDILLVGKDCDFADGIRMGKREAIFDMINTLAELKKKYTEESRNDR